MLLVPMVWQPLCALKKVHSSLISILHSCHWVCLGYTPSSFSKLVVLTILFFYMILYLHCFKQACYFNCPEDYSKRAAIKSLIFFYFTIILVPYKLSLALSCKCRASKLSVGKEKVFSRVRCYRDRSSHSWSINCDDWTQSFLQYVVLVYYWHTSFTAFRFYST